MNLSKKEVLTVEKPQQSPTKLTTLNPNAAEFIPSSLKSVSGRSNTAEASFDFASSASVTLGKTVLDMSGSSIPINSDEEAHQYWCRQLPDDITPDFKVMEDDDDSIGVKNLSFSNLSLSDVTDSPHLPGTGFMRKDQTAFSPNHVEGRSFMEHLRYPVSSHGEDLVSSSFHHFSSNPWGHRKTVSRDQFLSNLRDGSSYCGKSRHGFLSNTINDQQYSGHADNNPVEFLASQFPGFAADSLAEVYFANGGDLNLTIEMLTQLELQVDGDFGQNEKSKVFSAPNLSLMDFPALSTSDNNNTVPKFSDVKTPQSVDLYGSSDTDNLNFFKSGPSISSIGPIDFASAVRKMALQDSAMWKYDRNNGSASANVWSSRNSQLLASSYNSGQVKGLSGDRLQSRGSRRSTPVWLETGEAVANMYSEMREDAREHARLRNAYFEQARQAYLVGNKALAKELSAKGQLHNAQMKAAHGKAQDSIYRLRNPEIQGNGRIHGGGAGRTIDLHGLHVSEALQVLKRELTSLRNEARSADQRMQVYICVGTGHHTRGSRTPARLPLAVQRYLLEGEGLDFSEPQPGLLRVVIY